ncbi:unnamed protein product [Sympodiomycopsis kandeliae]
MILQRWRSSSAFPLLGLLVSLAACIVFLAPGAESLYYYTAVGDTKCFLEELPIDTVVVGHYMGESWMQTSQSFAIEKDIGVRVSVREKHGDHQLVDTIAPSEGKFAFTSHVAGDHEICLTPIAHDEHDSHKSGHHPQVRLHLDVIIGESKADNTHTDRAHIVDLAGRVKILNDRLKDIRKEQQYQREREALFRDESEKTNARAVIYSAVQGVVLVAACVWQLRTLRGFFSEKKFS